MLEIILDIITIMIMIWLLIRVDKLENGID